ncbi:uncharacterized protein LOC129572562, partial [Sitodiplosis mosellana]|uniref:uncharacterized protein LOC129572562 n=1 Tax=Sitodiplosis mosellana TaxID=263140 RepID=UPI0024451D82
MGDEILNLHNAIGAEEAITSIQHHAYNPYTNSFNNNDEIRIVIQHQDLYVLPHESYIYIEGRVLVATAAAGAEAAAREVPNFVNNAAGFLFDEIRYELNGFPIDCCKNVGITSTLKGYASYKPSSMNRLHMAGWKKESNQPGSAGYINFCIPLKSIFGFAEDYRNIIMNAKHELILLRSRSDINCFVGANDLSTIQIDKIQWRIPHINVADAAKIKLLKVLDRQQPILLHFRTWELFEYPVLPTTNNHIWSVKASSSLNTPRYIMVAFQTNRNNRIGADKSRYDHCALSDLKVYLNSESYPYENLNVNFANNQYAVLYDMYCRFQETYYHDRAPHTAVPLLTYEEYGTNAPIIIIDCSRQNEALKKSIIDIRIEFQTRNNIAANTAAYCLIIHDNIISYNP